MTLFGDEEVPIVLENESDVEILNSDDAPPTVTIPKSLDSPDVVDDDESTKMLDTMYECPSSLDTQIHSVDSEMKDALERIENDSTPPPPSTSDSVSIKGSKTPTIPLMTTVITNNNLTTPSAKLPGTVL